MPAFAKLSKHMPATQEVKNDPIIDALFKVGAHYGYARSRRHPSVKPFIFGVKNRVDIFNLEKSKELLERAKDFARQLGKEGKQVLFVGGKHETLSSIKKAAADLDAPFVAGRWVGGTFTNFSVIRARIDKLIDLRDKREKGDLSKYTKKERLLIDREIDRLEHLFSGLVDLKGIPGAIFVVDPGREHIAVAEATLTGVPVVALASSDCDLSKVTYPMVGNDTSSLSISYFVNAFVDAYHEGRTHRA